MPIGSLAPLILLSLAAVVLGGLNGYQAVTGRRLSKQPSVRDDRTMRRQSAVACAVLLVVGAAGLVVVVLLASS